MSGQCTHYLLVWGRGVIWAVTTPTLNMEVHNDGIHVSLIIWMWVYSPMSEMACMWALDLGLIWGFPKPGLSKSVAKIPTRSQNNTHWLTKSHLAVLLPSHALPWARDWWVQVYRSMGGWGMMSHRLYHSMGDIIPVWCTYHLLCVCFPGTCIHVRSCLLYMYMCTCSTHWSSALPSLFFVLSSFLPFFLPFFLPPSLPAERKTSLGKDWHPTCLRCDNCDRLLTPGKHSEVHLYICTCIHVYCTCTGIWVGLILTKESSPILSSLVCSDWVVCMNVYYPSYNVHVHVALGFHCPCTCI